VRDVTELQNVIRERSLFPPERTEELIASYFRRVPLRTQYAIERFHVDEARVLDVGCAFGTSLFHFGKGSVGLDNNPDASRSARRSGSKRTWSMWTPSWTSATRPIRLPLGVGHP